MSRRRPLAVALCAAVASAGCDALLTEPAPAPPEVSVSFALQAADGPGVGAAFAKVDRVFLRFVRPDSASRDTVIRLSPRDGTARVRLVLDTRERISALGVFAALAKGGDPLFEGSRVVRVQVGQPTSAEIPLTPVAARVRASRPAIQLTVGDTLRLSSSVTFATGDTIAGLTGVWASENPLVVFVTPGGLAAARQTGDTRLVVRYRDLADTVLARVRAR